MVLFGWAQSHRMKHISAEQKRRFNIKIGFGNLNSLVSPNSKSISGPGWCCIAPPIRTLCLPSPLQISHALTLQKTVEYIAKLQQERSQMQKEAQRLREETVELNAAIM
ncbi:hypothetical protein Chor_012944 [Crotalus horridus]